MMMAEQLQIEDCHQPLDSDDEMEQGTPDTEQSDTISSSLLEKLIKRAHIDNVYSENVLNVQEIETSDVVYDSHTPVIKEMFYHEFLTVDDCNLLAESKLFVWIFSYLNTEFERCKTEEGHDAAWAKLGVIIWTTINVHQCAKQGYNALTSGASDSKEKIYTFKQIKENFKFDDNRGNERVGREALTAETIEDYVILHVAYQSCDKQPSHPDRLFPSPSKTDNYWRITHIRFQWRDLFTASAIK